MYAHDSAAERAGNTDRTRYRTSHESRRAAAARARARESISAPGDAHHLTSRLTTAFGGLCETRDATSAPHAPPHRRPPGRDARGLHTSLIGPLLTTRSPVRTSPLPHAHIDMPHALTMLEYTQCAEPSHPKYSRTNCQRSAQRPVPSTRRDTLDARYSTSRRVRSSLPPPLALSHNRKCAHAHAGSQCPLPEKDTG